MDDPYVDSDIHTLQLISDSLTSTHEEGAGSASPVRQPYKTVEISASGEKRKTKPKIPKHLKLAPPSEANAKHMEVSYLR